MSSAVILMVAIKASLSLTVFAIGLRARPRDAAYLLRHPQLLARSIVSMYVITPLFALGATALFGSSVPVKLALIALAISPVPPLLPNKVARAGGEASYTVGLFVAASVLSIAFVPAEAWAIGALLGKTVYVPGRVVLPLVGFGIIAPLVAGIGVRRLWPNVSDRAADWIAPLALSVLVVALLPILVGSLRPMAALIGNGTVLVMVIVSVAALTSGHLLGGPESGDRTVLALASAARHPGVAIAIAAVAVPEQNQARAAILLAFLVTYVVSVPYVVWLKRRQRDRSPTRRAALQQRRTSSGVSDAGAVTGYYARRRDDR